MAMFIPKMCVETAVIAMTIWRPFLQTGHCDASNIRGSHSGTPACGVEAAAVRHSGTGDISALHVELITRCSIGGALSCTEHLFSCKRDNRDFSSMVGCWSGVVDYINGPKSALNVRAT